MIVVDPEVSGAEIRAETLVNSIVETAFLHLALHKGHRANALELARNACHKLLVNMEAELGSPECEKFIRGVEEAIILEAKERGYTVKTVKATEDN